MPGPRSGLSSVSRSVVLLLIPLFALYSSCCTEIFFITFGKCIGRLQTLMDLATLPLSQEEQLHAS